MKSKDYKTLLALITVFIIWYVPSNKPAFLIIAGVLSLLGVLSENLTKKVVDGWNFASEKIGNAVSKVLLTVVFYVVVTPLAFTYRLFSKDPLLLQKPTESTFINRVHIYTADDFEKQW